MLVGHPIPMKIRPLVLLTLLLSALLPASAAELAGKWLSEVDTQIGAQKYAYEFKQEGDVLTGTATYEHSLGKGTVALQAVKLDGDRITFSEPLKVEGMELTISYHGTLAGDELKLTRQVGDFATEELTARRAPAQP